MDVYGDDYVIISDFILTVIWGQDIAFFDAESVGALTSRLGSDCQQVSRIIGNDLNIMFRNGLQVCKFQISERVDLRTRNHATYPSVESFLKSPKVSINLPLFP